MKSPVVPIGVSLARIPCPACGEILSVPLLIEGKPNELSVSGDWDVVRAHIRKQHPEAVS